MTDQATTPAPAQPLSLNREALTTLIAENMGGALICGRAWSAWGCGTMAEDDFSDAAESDIPGEIADAILAAAGASEIRGAVPAAPAPMATDWFDLVMAALESLRGATVGMTDPGALHCAAAARVQHEREARELLKASQPPADPMDWPLPCDVTVGSITIRAGCSLRTLVARMQTLHGLARGQAMGTQHALAIMSHERSDMEWAPEVLPPAPAAGQEGGA